MTPSVSTAPQAKAKSGRPKLRGPLSTHLAHHLMHYIRALTRRGARLALALPLLLSACGGGGGDPSGAGTTYTLDVTVNGSGSVTSATGPLDCASSCNVTVAENTAVTLTAVAATGFTLQAWGGACSGSAPTCTVTMDAARGVVATFVSISQTPRFALGGTLSGLTAGASVVLSNNGANELTLAANGSFQFSQQVVQGASYSVSVATPPGGQTCTVSNGSGTMQAAVSDVQVVCVTSVAGWQPPVALSSGGASAPRIAMDDQGNGLAVWGQNDTDVINTSLWFSRYSAATGQWSEPALVENLSGSSGYATGEAHLAMHRATGRAVLTWLQTQNGTVDVWARDYDPTTGWGTATNLESVSGMTGTPTAGVDASGNAMVAWAQMTPRWSIWASRFVRGTGWGPAQLLETNDTVGGIDADPMLAISDNGQALVAWKAVLHNSTINGLWTTRFTPDAGWATPERRIATPAGGPVRSRPAIAADAQGHAVLAWGQIDVDATGTWHSMQTLRFDGTTWTTTPALVGTRQTVRSTVANPMLVMAPGGTAVLAWAMSESQTLLAGTALPGAAFGSVATLNTGLAAGDVTGLAVAANDGGAMVGWRQSGTSGAALHVQRYASAGTWTRDTIATDASVNDTVWGFDAGVGLNAGGQALVGWSAATSSGSVVRARRYVAP